MDVMRRSAKEQKQAATEAGYSRIVWHSHDDGLAAYVPFEEVEARTANHRGAVVVTDEMALSLAKQARLLIDARTTDEGIAEKLAAYLRAHGGRYEQG